MNFHEITIHIWPKTNEPANYTQKTHSCANISLYGLVILILMGCCSELPISSNAENITAEPQGSSANPFMSEKQARSVAFEFSESVEGSSLCNAQLKRSYILSTHPTADFHPITFPTAEVLQALEPGVFHHTPITSEYLDTMWFVVPYQNDETSSPSYWAHAFTNPRYMNVGHSETSVVDRASYMLYLPIAATKIMLYCSSQMEGIAFDLTAAARNTKVGLDLEHPLHSSGFQTAASPSSDNSGIVSSAIQYVGPPDIQFNIVFVSSGYVASQQALFNRDVLIIVNAFANPENFRSAVADVLFFETVPWMRYFPFTNVFSVFQPSAQQGVSTIGGETVNNNLDCSYPADPQATGLRCDLQLSLALAQASLARAQENRQRTLVIALVNQNRYGGTGIHLPDAMLATFSNSLIQEQPVPPQSIVTMTSLVAHELGHAIANLMDEYDTGVTANANSRTASNCSVTSNLSNSPWAVWLSAQYSEKVAAALQVVQSDLPTYGVSIQPVEVCGFANYYRPATTCMMRELSTYHLCPVCREAGSIMMLNTIGISFLWPQCPLKDQLVMIPQTSTEIQHVFVNIALERTNDFMVTWSVDHPQIMLENCSLDLMANTCRQIRPSVSGYPFTGAFTITARIVHDTTWIVKDVPNASWTQATTFSFFVYNEATAPLVPNYTSSLEQSSCKERPNILDYSQTSLTLSYDYYCSDIVNATCVLPVTTPTYEQPNTEIVLEDFVQVFFYIVIGITIVCALIWMYSVYRFYVAGQQKARPIFKTKYRTPIRIMTYIMNTSSVLLMILSFFVLILGLYVYRSLGPFGQVVLAIGLIIALLAYGLALVEFWAVQNRGITLLVVSQVFLVLTFLFLLFISVSLHMLSLNNNNVWQQTLQSLWRFVVRRDPNFACQAELFLRCTGWIEPCDLLLAEVADCPVCPAALGKPWFSCRTSMINFILAQNRAAFIVSVLLTVATLIGVCFNAVLLYEIIQMTRNIQRKNMKRLRSIHHQWEKRDELRALRLLRTLNSSDVAKMQVEFNKIDRDNNGEVDRKELSVFFRRTLCYNPTERELDKIFDVADLSGRGSFSFPEFLAVLDPNQYQEQIAMLREARAAASGQPNEEQEITMLQERHYSIRRSLYQALGDEKLPRIEAPEICGADATDAISEGSSDESPKKKKSVRFTTKIG